MTTGGSASTKGADATLISSTNFDVYWVEIHAWAYGNTATDSQGSMDIWIGTDPEEVIIPDLLMGFCGSWAAAATAGPKHWAFPLYIPAGTAIGCRAAGQRVSTTLTVGISVYGGDAMPPFRVGRKVTTYGMGTVPFGTTIVPGASGAEGSWTAITTSTSEDHFAFLPSFQNGTDTTLGNITYFADIGVAASGDAASTAVEIGQSWMFRMSSDERGEGWIPFMPAFIDVPSGNQLTMRVSASGALDGGNYNAVIHAVS